MKKIYLLLLTVLFAATTINAQISVTATAGTPGPTAYTTLSDAFTAINAGTHQGVITIDINASFTDAAISVLNSSGAGTASYTSVLIRPAADGVTMSFATVTGRGIIELNGADNVTIDGDNPNTAGTNRNLTITNTAANTVTFTSAIRLATSTLITSCDNVTIRNLNLNGSGTGRNTSAFTTEAVTWGIIASGGASTVAATTAPSALASATTTIASGQTALNFTATNNAVNTASRGISFNGAAITVCPVLTVTNNNIGNPTAGAANQVYVHGISVQGFNTGTIVSGNTVYVESWVGTAQIGIDNGTISANGTNAIFENNKILRVNNNSTGGFGAYGINLASSTATTNNTVRNNFVTNVINKGTASFSTTFGVYGIRIATGTNNKIYFNSVNLFGNNLGTGSNIMAAFGIVTTAATGTDVRNNIFSNTADQPAVGNVSVCVSVYLPTSGTAAMNLTMNNNDYFTGSVAGKSGVAQVGTSYNAVPAGPATYAGLYTLANFDPTVTTPNANFRAYTSILNAAGTNDNASAKIQPIFTSNADLHLNAGANNALNNLGTTIAGITTDIDGDTRNVTTPDMGADEFTPCVPPTNATASSNSPVCAGGTLNLTGVTDGTSFLWNGPNGFTSTSQNPSIPGVTLAAAGIYTFQSFLAGCPSAPSSTTVVINAAPLITSATATPASICAGANSQLNATVDLGSPVNSYSLNALTGQTYTTLAGAGITIINTNAQLTPGMGSGAQDDGGVVITLPFSFTYLGNTFTQMSMCTNGWVGAGNQGTIDAVSMRVPANLFSSTIPNNTIAAWFKDMGANFPLGVGSMRHGLIGPDVYAFQWDKANGSGFGDAATVLISFQVNIHGPASATPGRVEVIYGPTVGALTFSAAEGIEDAIGGNDHFINALNGSGTSTALSTVWPGDGNGYRFDPIVPTYLWSPSTFLSSTTIPNPVATAVTTTTTYTLTVTGPNGCSSVSNVTVTVLSPNVSAVLVQPTTCVTTDGSINLTVSGGTGGVGPYSFAWTGPGVNPTSQNQTNLGVGSYTVTVTDIPSGCTRVITYALPGPGGCNICPTVATLTTNPTPTACQNANVTLTASGLANMGVTYGITFKHSNVALADPYAAGTVIATVPNAGLTSGGTVASTVTTFAAAGSYFIYAILSPTPVDPGCRPFAQTTLTVNASPTVNAVANQAVCRGASTAAVNFSGSPVGTVFNWTNNTPSIGLAASGTGNIASFVAINNTSLPIVATITVTPTFAGCSGTPITFTITVNPNLPLVIQAVPGTTLCEGDPAALTVYESTGTAPVTVTHSSSNTITAGIGVSCGTAGVSTAINSYWRVYNLSAFPAVTGNFTINSVNFGIEQLSGGTQLFTVRLYNQTGAAFPGGTRTLIASQIHNIPVQNLSIYTATFAVPPTVTNTQTIVVEVEKSAVVVGQFFWPGGNAAAETGPSYISAPACAIVTPVTYASIGFPNTHLVMALAGTIPGIGGIATGTFLWSPAAGLSSTTTNPTAASPATTTTYTVVRTTPAGCTGTANITLTVNQRPVVTAHPVNVTSCATSTVTFTAAGTGTGLTYQWQESTNGGLSYTNLSNIVPYSGVNTATLTINPVTAAMNNNRYRVVLGGTCPPGNPALNVSTGAILTVNALPVVTISPSGQVCGGVAGTNGTPLTASGATSYVWSPIGGLYTNASATTAYTGTNLATVYAAPSVNTIYTVTGTNGTTGCSNTATITVVFTPVPPTVVPASASVCLGGTAQQLTIQAATPITQTFSSGPLTLAVPDNTPNGVNNVLNVPVPANAVISDMTVAINMTHTWDGDMAFVLKAPNNNILNLIYFLSGTGGAGATTGFTNTRIGSAAGLPAISTGANPYGGLYRPDAQLAPGAFGPAGPTGFDPNVTTFPALWSVPNGNYTLAMWDGGPADLGILTSWSITMTYTAGAPPPVNGIWTPIAGLFMDAAATIPYVANTPAQTVYALPTVSTTYSVTVSSTGPDALQTFTNPAPITITNAGSTPYPSNLTVSGLPTTGVSVRMVRLNAVSHTWSDDVDIMLQSPTGQNVILMSDVGGASIITNATYTFDDAGNAMGAGANPTGTYRPTNIVGTLGIEPDNFPAPGPGSVPQATPTLGLFGNTANVNGIWKLFVVDDFAGDDGSIAGGYSIIFSYPTPGCTSAPRLVPITVNTPVAITGQPVNASVCTNNSTTFSVTVTGTTPTFQWQVSTDNGNTWANVTNGGVYSGATTSTLTITAPPLSMNNYFYRVVVNGTAPCGSVTSFQRILTVNALPTIVIAASPYTSLLPGLFTNLTSTVTPTAAATYTWLRNGVAVPGGTGASLVVGIDGLGDYTLRVTNINGCTSTSNMITIRDSVSGRVFIYPNPNTGIFQVRYYSASNNTGLPRGIVIYDAKGSRVFIQNYTIGRPYDRMDVDMRKFGTGVYTLEIVDANGNRLAIGRVVVVR